MKFEEERKIIKKTAKELLKEYEETQEIENILMFLEELAKD